MNVSKLMQASPVNDFFSNFSYYAGTSTAPWNRIILATSVAGLVGLGAYRWNKQASPSYQQTTPLFPKPADSGSSRSFEQVQARVLKAYGYVFGGLTVTTATAAIAHISGLSLKILVHSYYSIPLMLLTIGSVVATTIISKEDSKAKHLALATFNISIGLTLSVLGFSEPAILAQAAVISLGLGALLTLTARLAPDRQFMKWEGPLVSALACISIASTVAIFFPFSAFAYAANQASLYGGLAISCLFLMSSTQRLIENAEKQTDQNFDAISDSLNIYLDGLNIFLKVFRILMENKMENKKDKKPA